MCIASQIPMWFWFDIQPATFEYALSQPQPTNQLFLMSTESKELTFSHHFLNLCRPCLPYEKEPPLFFIPSSRQEPIKQLKNKYGEITGDLIKAINPKRVVSDYLITN